MAQICLNAQFRCADFSAVADAVLLGHTHAVCCGWGVTFDDVLSPCYMLYHALQVLAKLAQADSAAGEVMRLDNKRSGAGDMPATPATVCQGALACCLQVCVGAVTLNRPLMFAAAYMDGADIWLRMHRLRQQAVVCCRAPWHARTH